MFWRERDQKDLNDDSPSRQIRVLVVGDSGVGKTSLVHLIMKGSSIARPSQTVGCAVSVKHTACGGHGSSSSSTRSDIDGDFFIELWEISGNERYKDCRSLFYSQINGVIFVHDLSQRRTKTSLHKWAAEIASAGTFLAPLASGGPGGLPVPCIVIGNKADIPSKDRSRVSSGNLVDVARQWVEKQGLLPSTEELPLIESFPSSGGLIAAAMEARYDKEALMKFFRMLIRRRYFPDELPSSTPRSSRDVPQSSGIVSDEIHNHHPPNTSSLLGDSYRYNTLPPRGLYPQQPTATHDNYYSIPRFAVAGAQESSNTRSKRPDINV